MVRVGARGGTDQLYALDSEEECACGEYCKDYEILENEQELAEAHQKAAKKIARWRAEEMELADNEKEGGSSSQALLPN